MRGMWIRMLVALAMVIAVGACGGSDDSSGTLPFTTLGESTTTTVADSATVGGDPPYFTWYDSLPGWSEEWGLIRLDTILVLLADDAVDGTLENVVAALSGTVVGQTASIPLYEVWVPTDSIDGIASALAAARSIPGVAEVAAAQYGVLRAAPVCGVSDSTTYAGAGGAAYEAIGLERAYQLIRGSGRSLNDVHIGVIDTTLPISDETRGPGAVDLRPVKGVNRLEKPWPANPDGSGGGTPPPHIEMSPTPGMLGNHSVSVTNILAGSVENGGVNGVTGGINQHVTLSHATVFGRAWGIDQEEWARLGLPEELYTGGYYGAVAEGSSGWIMGQATLSRSIGLMEGLIADGAKVINFSVGPSELSSRNLASASIARAYLRRAQELHPDVTFVVAAGNHGQALDGLNDWFAGQPLPNVITVSAVDADGGRPDYANTATGHGEVSLVALGALPVSVDPTTGETITKSGTSFAAPQVAGAAALLRALDPTLKAGELKDILVGSGSATTSVGGASVSVDPAFGAKMLRIDQAVYRVLRERLGVGLEYDELIARGSLTVTAAQTTPLSFDVTASLASALPEGTQVFVDVDGAGTLGGISPQILQRAGAVTWPFTFSEAEQQATLTATRRDTGACAHVTVVSTQSYAGTYAGVLPFAIPGPTGTPVASYDIPFTASVSEDGSVVASAVWAGTYDYGSGVTANMSLAASCTGSIDAEGRFECAGDWLATTAFAGLGVPVSFDDPGTITITGSIAGDVLTGTVEKVGGMGDGTSQVTATRQ